MFKHSTIEKAIGSSTALSQSMADKIEQWDKMLRGNADWIDNDSIHSLRLEQAIVKEFANISLNEMSVNITNEKLKTVFDKATEDLNEHLQKGLALGAMIVKPVSDTKVQYITQGEFIPIQYDVSGKPTNVIFPDVKKISDNNYYIRLEQHCLDSRGLTITNKAFRSSDKYNIGNEIPLSLVDEWKNLTESVTYPLMTRQAFGYYRNPNVNNIDDSFCGVSVFDAATHLIKKADIQFGRLDWEFESGERAIHVDDIALNVQDKNGKRALSKLNKRLYRGLNLQGSNGEELFKEFSPQLREDSIINGLEEYKRNIEFAVGLSYGDISNPQYVEKTATEIKSAKKRKYNTVSAIQRKLKDCLDDLCYALAFYNSLTTSGYEFICDFKDSILTDEETERKQDKEDMALGILRPEEYRSKWYGEPIEEALKNLPAVADVME